MTAITCDKKSNTNYSGPFIWGLIIPVLFLAAIGYFIGESDNSNWVETHIPHNKKLDREVSVIFQETNHENKEAYNFAMKEQSYAINAAFDSADGDVEPTLDELVSFKGSAILCYYLAKDKIYGNSEAEKRIQSVLEMHIGRDILEANQRMENALVRLNDRLARNMTDTKVRLASATERVLDPGDEKTQSAFRNFVERLSSVSGSFKDIAFQTMAPTTGLAISGLLVKATWGQITRVLGPIARRLSVTTGLALGSAAADGPIPIGDAIALVLEVGGASWCAYDLYNTQVTLRDDVGRELRNALSQYRGELLELGKKRSTALLKAYSDQYHKMVKDLTKQLS